MIREIDPQTWRLVFDFAKLLGGAIVATIPLWLAIRATRGPRLSLSLVQPAGILTTFGQGGPPAFFYHLLVSNRDRTTAKNVRVRVVAIRKGSGSNRDSGEQLSPTFLIWAAHPSPKMYLIDILGLDCEPCNLAYIKNDPSAGKPRLQLDAMEPARFDQNDKWPLCFRGYLEANEGSIEVDVVAVAENSRSNALTLRCTWDGEWSDQPDQMCEHLQVKPRSLTYLSRIRSRLGWASVRL